MEVLLVMYLKESINQAFGIMKWEIFKIAVSDREAKEFHITPVITYAWKDNAKSQTKSKGIGFEWGWWALIIGIIYQSKN